MNITAGNSGLARVEEADLCIREMSECEFSKISSLFCVYPHGSRTGLVKSYLKTIGDFPKAKENKIKPDKK